MLLIVSLCEHYWPRRPLAFGLPRQWTNYGLTVCNTLVLRLLMPWLAVDAALYAQQQQIGIYHLWLAEWSSGSMVVSLVICTLLFLLLDMAIYWQHRAMHTVPLLWRLHRVHHSDQAIDTSTGLRFHPLEIMVSMLYKIALVLLLGMPVVVLILFEILLNAASLFNHGNLNIPLTVDKRLRRVIVTPDMHRIHHSQYPNETNSNYGFSVSWWDFLFRSYCRQPQLGQQHMQIGLREYPTAQQLSFGKLLAQPFR